MKVETVKISSLNADPENARKHSQKNIDVIAISLDKFGQRRPLVVWDNIIIAGNGTVEAAKSLGWQEIQITRVPAEWSSDKARAYALADNRSSELATWDSEVLANQLIDLDSMGFNMKELGFRSINENPGEFLDGLAVDLEEEIDPAPYGLTGRFVAPETYPLPYGFPADQRALIIKAINHARDDGQPDAPTALAYIAGLYLDERETRE